MSWLTALWVALGSMLGSVGRHGIQDLMTTHSGAMLVPLGTLAVNALGSLTIGWLAGRALPTHHSMAALNRRQFAMTGFCGGFTTFSIFSLETLMLIEAGEWLAAWLNLGLTTVLALAAVALGFTLARKSDQHIR